MPSRHPEALRVNLDPGQALPLDDGAISRVLLAYAPTELVDEAAAQASPALTGRRRKELDRELAAIVVAGIARSEGAPIPGSVTISVPIMREDGIIAALSVIGPETAADSPGGHE